MISAQSMQPADGRIAVARRARWPLIALLLVSGCGPRLTNPAVLEAPYPREQLWAVAPFANESGASVVDSVAMTDTFAQEAHQVRGINTIPVNRVIKAMRTLQMDSVSTHGDALTLMNVLKLDALVVGTITAYDPYRPMTLGMAVHLYARPAPGPPHGMNPRALTRATSGHAAPGELGPPRPVAQAAGVFEAANHHTLKQLKAFASGRNEPDSAYGDDIYLVSMDLYAHFVCYRLLHDLFVEERTRLTPVAEQHQVAR